MVVGSGGNRGLGWGSGVVGSRIRVKGWWGSRDGGGLGGSGV